MIYGAIRFFCGAFLLIPFRLSFALAKPLGIFASWVAISDRKKAIRHLAIVFPEKTPAQHRALARSMFIHLARCGVESAHIGRFLYGKHRVALSEEDLEIYRAARDEGRGFLGITGHIGNWELLAQAVVESGIATAVIAKPTYDPRLTRLAHNMRCAKGLQIIYRRGGQTREKMLGVLKDKAMLAMLIDQDTKVPGAFVPFFGKLAHTPITASKIAIENDLPVLVGWIHRQDDGSFKTKVRRIEVPSTGDFDADVWELTRRLNQTLEEAIRQAPEQWVWLHRRWRRRPE